MKISLSSLRLDFEVPSIHFGLTSISLRVHLAVTSVSLRLHSERPLRFDFSSDPLLCHFDITSVSLAIHFGFTSVSLRCHFDVTPV